ncbi:virulence genes transcriptional activator SpvR, partial [Salmonella enterica subsp. enterica serovar Typhimurium]
MDFLINKKLKIFITLMETGSFSIATSVLYITRTPLSRVISDLERELKQRLFIRKNGTLIPTEFAQTIYRKVKSHYIFLHALEQEIGPTGKTKQLEIIFDEIYPGSLKNLIISALTISGQKTNIMGRAVNSQIIEELCQTNNCIVISARNYFHRESLVCRTSVEGGVMLFIPKKFFLCGKPDINRLAGTPVLFHEGAKNFNLDTIYHFFEQT